MGEITETAWAKINLALHITGQRDDGYHLIDSLVAFADMGDRLTFTPGARDVLTLAGPFSGSLNADDDNLVARARALVRDFTVSHGRDAPPVAIHLEKNLPVASGIGGGSADAAATLRGLARFWSIDIGEPDLSAMALSLGADVPMCLVSKPLLARGIGDQLDLLDSLATLPMLLVNPLEAVSTPAAFDALESKNNAALQLSEPLEDIETVAAALKKTRNDLEAPARRFVPAVDEICAALCTSDALFWRMSGSGATCYGIFRDPVAARLAGDRLRDQYPHWWVQTAMTSGAP
ncbi:4-(cytidine 5'-diphospho)-2-C-methyl-D-erythritol kinase [Hoeflea prorocentri]|uniref:4-diphosphocytidyl-2-C-methyl-D-erythritol kinase n=1 Tax=Hoeflea prorocentri TaxID=1922333 RepID=A0A9X3UMB6_9HYPH|nr:4-(cytidine 5'-diphospho)-2-C-methyl-D-erythritol kinase [Hoeflea prorocentri]MCY6381711.1 4-(cytidine 5'-diphospho)-2-C-methyl-D-erythritol kinase [Hoeflea prorocentri]MDA5399511.1 4-(cytidine 5'-diphospho)-2-C-methyl-D-erythritol kinase [Hoeflea prorocentri]